MSNWDFTVKFPYEKKNNVRLSQFFASKAKEPLTI